MSDSINRADAIEAMDERWGDIKRTNKRVAKGHEAVYLDMRATISALPSADAVQGEWIDIDNYYRMATCSRCHKVTMFEKWGKYTKPYDFCPNCGARMKGGAE